ncbi:PepSY-associated TM helix domain-containing protein [Parapedobacter deserti]|uniref:PepSY-associated TM helix domain-containing protein n=1 Tax=Parapedobacter deserti TaxID=1912957 RepID=A0ABV7JNX6_9SPHI
MKRQLTTWARVRKFFNDLHLWLGLASGIVVIVVCLSGTIYTYNTELREMAAKHLHKVEVPVAGQRLPADSLTAVVAQSSGGRVTAVAIPADLGRSFEYTVRTEGDKSRFGTTYYVNPYTGELLGTSKEETRVGKFMGYMFSLHRWLLLDKVEQPIFGELPNRQLGSYITGAATILFTLGVITGLIIWFPRKLRTWRQGLKIKWTGGWKRLNHDLHNTLAFYSLIFLFLMGVTGPQWSFPWYREGLQKTLGTYREAPAGSRGGSAGSAQQSSGRDGAESSGRQAGNRAEKAAVTLLPIAQYLAAADEALPYRGDYRIMFPAEGDSILSITKNRVGFFAPAAGDQLKIDAATASVKDITIFRDKPFNERIAGSIKALHIGNLYGQFTKLLYFLACLIATSLPITGTLIWLNKMKKKPSSRKRKIPELVAD